MDTSSRPEVPHGMRRRSLILLIAILIGLTATGGSALALMLHHVPSFYRGAAIPADENRSDKSLECIQTSIALWNDVSNGLPWEKEFCQDHLNSYFQEEDTHTSGSIIELPDGVRDIRVSFDDNRGRIGFRYGTGWFSCIISVEYRFWLVAQKTNVVALELVSFRAGALPLGTQALLDFITETARQQNIDVTWYRHNGHPVALLQFQANQPRPNTLLRKLELKSGRVVVAGSRPPDLGQSP
jgi:hypothetical protein